MLTTRANSDSHPEPKLNQHTGEDVGWAAKAIHDGCKHRTDGSHREGFTVMVVSLTHFRQTLDDRVHQGNKQTCI